MNVVAAVLVCVMTAGLPTIVRASGDGAAADSSQKWQVLLHTVQEILSGEAPGPYSARIAPGAQLVLGDRMLDLGEVVASRDSNALLEDQTRGPVSLHLKMNDEENAAFLVLVTQPDAKARYHTVVFMRDTTGAWLVESWHASR